MAPAAAASSGGSREEPDWRARQAELIGRMPEPGTGEAIGKLGALLG
jgi:hypothetical protein